MDGVSQQARTDEDGLRVAAAFPAVDRPRAADAVVRALIDGIRAGVVAPGERLPRAEEFAEAFGVSRLVVREALDQLRRAGVLTVRRGSGGGAFLASLDIPTELLTDRDELDRHDLRDLLEARRALETTCALLAGERATPESLAELEDLVRRLEQATDDPTAFIELDVHFHLRLAASAGNRELARLLAVVFRDLSVVREGYPIGFGDMQKAIDYQRETLDAVASGDRARVLETIDRHLAALERHFLGTPLPGAGAA
jgi:GntR family transcriptional repressor for pyruvate dehydrogenase complex